MEEYEIFVSESVDMFADYSADMLASELETESMVDSVSVSDGIVDYSFDFMVIQILLCTIVLSLLLLGKNDR